jgi:hypothetical protein
MDVTKVNERATRNAVESPIHLDAVKEVEEGIGLREDSNILKKAGTRPICEECGKTCANARMLGFHKAATHIKYDERTYGCEICGRRYAYPSHLVRHCRKKHANVENPSA